MDTSEKESVISARQIINFESCKYVKKELPANRVSSEQFSQLCEKLYNDKELFRVSEIVISAIGNKDPIQQGALYAVALETLTTNLGDKESKKPIEDRKIASEVVKELKSTLERYKNKISEESFNILDKKINSINSPTTLLSGEILPQRKLSRTVTLRNISSEVGLIKYIFDVASYEEDLTNRV